MRKPTDEQPPMDQIADHAADAEWPEQALCPHCLAEVGERDHFCWKCAGPLTSHASTDPLGQVYAAGYAYQQATSSRPRLIVLIGIWLIFGPFVLVMGLFLGAVLYDQIATDSSGSSLALLLSHRASESTESVFGSSLATGFSYALDAALMALSALVLWKVTARYLQGREVEVAEDC